MSEPNELARFLAGDTSMLDGDVRTCNWCGHTQNRRTWIESVERQTWESADGITRKRDEAEGGVNPKGAEA